MHFLDAVVLGIVEGITEFLPVSSTGHLLVTQRLLGIPQSESSNAFAIVIQFGAILAVLRIYGNRLHQLIEGLKGNSIQGRRLFWCVMMAFLPAAVIGKLFNEDIERHLFGPVPIVVAWIVGGFAILLWSKFYDPQKSGQPIEALHWRAALFIGLCQCLAMWPGTSRSLVTILAGVAIGLTLTASVEFSFLLGVVTLSAASVYSGLKHYQSLAALGIEPLLLGLFVSFISSYLAVKWMLDWINSRGLVIFGYWRIVAGVIVGSMVLTGTRF